MKTINNLVDEIIEQDKIDHNNMTNEVYMKLYEKHSKDSSQCYKNYKEYDSIAKIFIEWHNMPNVAERFNNIAINNLVIGNSYLKVAQYYDKQLKKRCH